MSRCCLGCCLLTDSQVKHFHRLRQVSNEELDAAGVEILADHSLSHKRSRERLQPDLLLPAVPAEKPRRVHVLGYCRLSTAQIRRFYWQNLISDEELAMIDGPSVMNLKRSSTVDQLQPMRQNRSSIIEEPRRSDNCCSTVDDLKPMGVNLSSMIAKSRTMLHEHNSTMNQRPQESPFIKDLAERVSQLQLRQGMRNQKPYEFQMLNELVRIMDPESDPKVIFPESHFDLDAIYWEVERAKFRRLEPKECKRLQFKALYEYLNEEFLNGDREHATNVVSDAFFRLSKQPEASGFMSPQSFELIPPKRKKVADEPRTSTEYESEI